MDSNLNQIVSYEYDSWGNILSIKDENGNEITDSNNIGLINPYRYRSYRYDTETGLYYLQSRYYSPEWGRFINADSIISDSILGTNIYVYCENNPINYCDSSGNLFMTTTSSFVCIAILVVCCVIISLPAITKMAELVCNSIVASIEDNGNSTDSPTDTQIENKAPVVSASPSSDGNNSNDESFNKNLSEKVSKPKGSQNPNTKAGLRRGRIIHKEWDYGPGVEKEYYINFKNRVDGIDFKNRIIYELKPNNPQGISRGKKQLERYVRAATKELGGNWEGQLVLYN